MKGQARLREGNTIEEQALLQKEGARYAASILHALKPILASRGITGRSTMPYFNFAQQLARLSRGYGGKSLQMAAADPVDLCEARPLNGDTLPAIARSVFGIDIEA